MSDHLRVELETFLALLKPEDDWYFGADTREKGEGIRRDGEKLLVERSSLEAEELKILTHLRETQKAFEEQKERERQVLVQAMEKTMEEFRASTKASTDERVAELIATRRDREMEFAQKEANAPPAQRAGLHDVHQEQLEGLTLNIQVR